MYYIFKNQFIHKKCYKKLYIFIYEKSIRIDHPHDYLVIDYIIDFIKI